jgi:hypothetical protein
MIGNGTDKAVLLAAGATLVIFAAVRALLGKGPEEHYPGNRDANAGFKSPVMFWFSVAWGFALGIAVLALAWWGM